MQKPLPRAILAGVLGAGALSIGVLGAGSALGAAPTPAAPPAPAPAAPASAAPASAAPAPAASEPTGSATPSAESANTEDSASPPPVSEPAPQQEPPPVADPAPTEPPPSEPAADAAVLASSTEPPPKPPSPAGPFARGRLRVGGMIGFSTAVGGGTSRSWFILGVGAGYYVLDGLEPHADTTFWIGDPFLATLTPGIRYVFHMVPMVKPYVGAFYRHYFVDGPLGDTDSIGGRAGVNFMVNDFSYVAGGLVYEHFLDEDLFAEADQFYPEIMISVSF